MADNSGTNDPSSIPVFKAIRDTAKLRQNAQGVYEIVYSYPDPEKGGWRSKHPSTKTKNFALAQDALIEHKRYWQEQIDLCARSERWTIEKIMAAYLDAKNVPSRHSVRSAAKGLCAIIGHYQPCEINDQVIADYMKARRSTRNGESLCSGSHRRALGAMNTAIRWAIKRKLVSAGDTPIFDMPDDSPPRQEYMTHEEEVRLWAAAQAQGGQLGLFVSLGLETAARKNALYSLTWERINFRTRTIELQDPTKPMTPYKRNATVPISDRLLPVLQAAHAIGPLKRGRVFDSKMQRLFENFVTRIGLAWVTPHIMRHTWASLAAIDGVPLYHIAKMLGDTIATVEKTYAKMAPSDLMNVVNRKRGAA